MGVKKSIYFSLDALLFASLITISLIFTYSTYIHEAPKNTISYVSQDLVNVLSTLTVGESNNPYVIELIDNGQIKRLNNTILEQVGEFWADQNSVLARRLLDNITYNLVPESFGFGIWINNEQIYSRNKTYETKSLISSQKIISGIAKDKPTFGFSAKVFFSGVSDRTVLSYAYFGGFVGDGIITRYLILPDDYDNITLAYAEFVVSSDFNLKINDIDSGSYSNVEVDELRADKYNISPSYYSNFNPGINKIEITFLDDSKFIGGGFFKVEAKGTDVSYLPFEYDGNFVTKKNYISGVDGVINIYSSFFVPGNLESIKMDLNYSTNFPLFVGFGNVTVYDDNVTGDIFLNKSNSYFNNIFNGSYDSLSSQTVPLRIGHFTTDKIGDFSRRTDSFIATDVSSSMDTQDIEDAPGQSRLDVAKTVEKKFVDFVFNKSFENRLGLVSYHSSVEPGQSQDLTNDNQTLKDKIDGYNTKSVNTCFSCAIGFARDKLIAQGNSSKKWSIILMSDGTADKCDAIPQSQCSEEAAKNESILYACDAFQNYNISIYAIGFGAGADNVTLKNVSEGCSDGLFIHSKNQSQLQAAFDLIAEDLLSLTFQLQKSIPSGVESTLYPDSYIELKYSPTVAPFVFGKLPINIESAAFGNNITNGTIEIPPEAIVTEALVTSYSSDRWTESVSINGDEVFDLSDYNMTYIEIGDPFRVNIPPNKVQQGSNTLDIRTASGPFPQNLSGGSYDDKIIYTILVPNAISYSSVAEKADGCNWFVRFEDGTNTTVKAPSSYSGGNSCNYENAIYNTNDAIDKSMFLLLDELDLDDDGLLDINVEQEDLIASVLIIEEVPSLWGPAIVEVRVW